jgi:hypothetical protein
MAAELASNTTTSRTTMAAAVKARNSSRGCWAQLKITIGMAVNRSRTWFVSKMAKSDPRKPVTAPTRRRGAASPRARASASTVPVRMPGAAYGRTWPRTTSQRVAPTPKPASRMLSGTARMASAPVMMTMGRTRTARVMPAAMMVRPPVKLPSALTKTAKPRIP